MLRATFLSVFQQRAILLIRDNGRITIPLIDTHTFAQQYIGRLAQLVTTSLSVQTVWNSLPGPVKADRCNVSSDSKLCCLKSVSLQSYTYFSVAQAQSC